jgi:hypothetical protein
MCNAKYLATDVLSSLIWLRACYTLLCKKLNNYCDTVLCQAAKIMVTQHSKAMIDRSVTAGLEPALRVIYGRMATLVWAMV